MKSEYEVGQKVNDDPLVYVMEDFVSAEDAQMMLEAAIGKLKRAMVTGDEKDEIKQVRTGSNCWIPHDYNPAFKRLSEKVSALVDMPLSHAESFQIIHYAEGQEYKPHYDAWDDKIDRGNRALQRGGQRLLTCLIYLNDVEEGGGTGFPKLDLEVRPRRGRMVLFHNCYPGTNKRHINSLHGGLPVLKGEKWAMNLWFREKEYQSTVKKTVSQVAKPAPPKYNRVI